MKGRIYSITGQINMREEIKEIIIIILGVMLFMGILTILLQYPLSIKCENRYDDTKFYILGGCMIKDTNGKYIPESLYKETYLKNFNINIK